MHTYYFHALLVLSLCLNGCKDLLVLEKEQKMESYFENTIESPLIVKEEYVIVTFNIQIGFKNGQKPSKKDDIGGTPDHLDSIVLALKSLNPDFIALQEVGRNVTNTLVSEQIEYLADGLEMNFAYGDYSELNSGYNPFMRGRRGNALLTKHKILSVKNEELLNPNRYLSRYCLVTEVQISERDTFSFLATHLASRSTRGEKNTQIDRLLRLTPSLPAPRIILGDFNDRLVKPHLNKVSSKFPAALNLAPINQRASVELVGTSNNSGRVIDHTFIEDNYFEVVEVGLMKDFFWNLSDHKAFFAKVVIK